MNTNRDGPLVIRQQIHDVSHSRRYPATTLVVELAETLRAMGVGIGCGAVLYSVASL